MNTLSQASGYSSFGSSLFTHYERPRPSDQSSQLLELDGCYDGNLSIHLNALFELLDAADLAIFLVIKQP
jgi:hypothetical protein